MKTQFNIKTVAILIIVAILAAQLFVPLTIPTASAQTDLIEGRIVDNETWVGYSRNFDTVLTLVGEQYVINEIDLETGEVISTYPLVGEFESPLIGLSISAWDQTWDPENRHLIVWDAIGNSFEFSGEGVTLEPTGEYNYLDLANQAHMFLEGRSFRLGTPCSDSTEVFESIVNQSSGNPVYDTGCLNGQSGLVETRRMDSYAYWGGEYLPGIISAGEPEAAMFNTENSTAADVHFATGSNVTTGISCSNETRFYIYSSENGVGYYAACEHIGEHGITKLHARVLENEFGFSVSWDSPYYDAEHLGDIYLALGDALSPPLPLAHVTDYVGQKAYTTLGSFFLALLEGESGNELWQWNNEEWVHIPINGCENVVSVPHQGDDGLVHFYCQEEEGFWLINRED